MDEVPANPGAVGTSDEGSGGGGDSSIHRAPSNNQEEEEEEDGDSAYGSEDFDDQSKAGGTESEVGFRHVLTYLIRTSYFSSKYAYEYASKYIQIRHISTYRQTSGTYSNPFSFSNFSDHTR